MGSQVFMEFVLIKSIPWWKHKIAVHSEGLSEHCTHTHTPIFSIMEVGLYYLETTYMLDTKIPE